MVIIEDTYAEYMKAVWDDKNFLGHLLTFADGTKTFKPRSAGYSLKELDQIATFMREEIIPKVIELPLTYDCGCHVPSKNPTKKCPIHGAPIS